MNWFVGIFAGLALFGASIFVVRMVLWYSDKRQAEREAFENFRRQKELSNGIH